MDKYVCDKCGYVYTPSDGDANAGIPAGTTFESLPDSWICPMCKDAPKSAFYKVTE